MNLISNYKNFSLKKFLEVLKNKKNFNILLLLFLQFIFLIALLINHRKFVEAYKYLKNIELSDISLYLKDLTTSYDLKNQIKTVDLQINFKNLSKLDCLRQRRNDCGGDAWAKGTLKEGNQIYPIKLKAKGDRDELHRNDIESMSFKVDIRGEKRFLGMEEFSIQHPIIRNYTTELLVSNIAKDNGIITGRNSYVKLYLNGKFKGLRHIEESPSRELIEASKRRYGPIFSLQENISDIFGKTRFDLADSRFWASQDSKLSENSLTVLEIAQQESSLINKFFDQKKWATYFALMDTFLSYHGSIPKSVRFYMNPTKGKFEPVFYDGHHGEGSFQDFILADFIQSNEDIISCGWICIYQDWYKAFFLKEKEVNKQFYINYFENLEKLVAEEYVENVIDKNINNLGILRGNLYRQFEPYDGTFFRGDIPHIFKISVLKNRIKYIRNLIYKAKTNEPFIATSENSDLISILNQSSKLPQIINFVCDNIRTKELILIKGKSLLIDLKNISPNCNKDNFSYTIDRFNIVKKLNEQILGNLDFKNNLRNYLSEISLNTPKEEINLSNMKKIIKKDYSFINKKIIINEDINLCLSNKAFLKIENSEFISPNNKEVIISGCSSQPGSILISNSKIDLDRLTISNLGLINQPLNILYSGFNVVNSDFKINSLNLYSSNTEDAINFIDSKVRINSVSAENIFSDAIDSDSSSLIIDKIYCNKVSNDCLDLSYSEAEIGIVKGLNIKDKAVSVGEASNVFIKEINVFESEVGLVVKDSSKVLVDNINLSLVKLPVATYIKKPELGSPFVTINSIKSKDLENSLISKDSNVLVNKEPYIGKLDSKVISNMLYGNIYGIKTIR